PCRSPACCAKCSPAPANAPRSTGPSWACRCPRGAWPGSCCSGCGRSPLPSRAGGDDRLMRGGPQHLQPVSLPEGWAPDSWRARPALQQPAYPDAAALAGTLRELRELPPLVTSWEILALRRQLADAQEGRRFLLQGGDCAEGFADCTPEVISNRLKVLLQMSLVLVHGLRLPVVRVGRFAGQYAKPRSSDMEVRDGVALPSYRGDIVNGAAFTAGDRTPDPRRMIKAHARS